MSKNTQKRFNEKCKRSKIEKRLEANKKYQAAYDIFQKTGRHYEVLVTHEGGCFWHGADDADSDSRETSEGAEIFDLKTAKKIYNKNNYGLVELREFINHDEYIILMSKYAKKNKEVKNETKLTR